MHVCACLYIHRYIYAFICVYTIVHASVYIHVYACICITWLRISACICTHFACIWMHLHVCAYTFVYMSVYARVFMYMRVYVHIWMYILCISTNMRALARICKHTHIYECRCFVCMCMLVHGCACIYIWQIKWKYTVQIMTPFLRIIYPSYELIIKSKYFVRNFFDYQK